MNRRQGGTGAALSPGGSVPLVVESPCPVTTTRAALVAGTVAGDTAPVEVRR
jgi:hypothetical protein